MATTGSPFSAPPYQGICTFGRRPHSRELAGVDVAILGVPYDSSTSYRSGARFGPRAIREQSLLLWGYNNAQQVAPFEVLKVVDYGDVDVVPVDILATHQAIEETAATILQSGSQLVTLGGDHSISLPLLRAHHAIHGPLAVVHFDAQVSAHCFSDEPKTLIVPLGGVMLRGATVGERHVRRAPVPDGRGAARGGGAGVVEPRAPGLAQILKTIND